MGVRIKDLATRAAKLITGNAWLIVDDGGSNVNKVDYKELAKQIIEEYNTSSLGGSAQTVKSAIDALNSNSILGRSDVYSGDLDSLITPGYWYAPSNASNIPSDFTAAHVLVFRVNARVIQLVFQYGGTKMAVRTSANSGSSWGTYHVVNLS